MPRDPDLLTDMARRQRVSTFDGERYPFPVPNGWFVVAEAAEIEPGEVRALHYFDRDLVLYRGADGTPHVMDAHCPHLGAHLAVGGRVEDDCIRCPFHGWKYDGGAGKCVEIPYGEVTTIPPKAHPRVVPDARAQPHDLGLVPRQGRRPVLRGARGARVPRRRLDADHRAGLRDPRRRAGHGREQRRLLALPLRARLRRHPRGRVHHRRHLQEDDRRRRQLHPRGLRPRASACCG